MMKIMRNQITFEFVIMEQVKRTCQCHVTGRYRGSAHRDFNIKVKLNNEVLMIFYYLKNYDSYVIMEKLGKFNSTVKVK